MDSASQWVSRMCRLFFADDYIRHTEGTPSASQTPNMESAFQAVQNALPKLENRVIEFLAQWLVALLAPARHVLETRSPHLSFMLLKEYWFRELYLSLKVTASFDRTESYVRVIDGQVRCITPDFKNQDLHVAWNVQYVVIFVPAWMNSPYVPQPTPGKHQKHGLKERNRGQILFVPPGSKTQQLQGDLHRAQDKEYPNHAWPSLMIKEEALIISDQPSFPAVAELAKRGLLSPETWQCNRPRISLKTLIDVPMLGDIIEQNCEKRKPKYTSCVPKSTLSLKSLRQTQTPTVVATPQLLTSPQCQIKELVPPRLLSARQTPSFLSRRHTQRNRSTRTRAGTQPQPTDKERKQAVPVWLLFQVP